MRPWSWCRPWYFPFLSSDTLPYTCQLTDFRLLKCQNSVPFWMLTYHCVSYSYCEEKQTFLLYGESDFPLLRIMTHKGRHVWSFCSLLYPQRQKYCLGPSNCMLNYLLNERIKLKSGQEVLTACMRQVMLSNAAVTNKFGNLCGYTPRDLFF